MDKIYTTTAKTLNKLKGSIGEAKAASFLQKNGYEILVTNYKCLLGEIDIIALDKTGRIIFVEVKSRETAKHGYPRESVTYDKQNKIRQVAEYYLKVKRQKNSFVRFDVIEILAEQITHIKNAF